MDKSAEIRKAIIALVGANPNLPILGTVTAVEGETCSVKLTSGLVVSDIRLMATVSDESDYLLLTPKIGSDVLMLSGDGSLRNLTVIKVDQISKFEYKDNGLNILFDGTDKKVAIRNEEVSLKEIFSNLADLLKKLKFYTPTGPSGNPLPDSITMIEQFENKFKQLLK